MKNIIKKYPVVAAIVINFTSTVIFMYTIKERSIIFITPLVFVGIINRQIIDNGNNLNKKKKIVIYISFFLLLAIGLVYNYYIYKAIENNIINNL